MGTADQRGFTPSELGVWSTLGIAGRWSGLTQTVAGKGSDPSWQTTGVERCFWREREEGFTVLTLCIACCDLTSFLGCPCTVFTPKGEFVCVKKAQRKCLVLIPVPWCLTSTKAGGRGKGPRRSKARSPGANQGIGVPTPSSSRNIPALAQSLSRAEHSVSKTSHLLLRATRLKLFPKKTESLQRTSE